MTRLSCRRAHRLSMCLEGMSGKARDTAPVLGVGDMSARHTIGRRGCMISVSRLSNLVDATSVTVPMQ
jgi:hypothetical protein